LVQVFVDAGVPAGVINLVLGVPAEVSAYLIPQSVIRKISFTGSTVVGKQLAALAGAYMKRATMELGGHAPAIVCQDADLAQAVKLLAVQKFWNAGQACISPSRFLVHESIYDVFLEKFVAAARTYKTGNGLQEDTRMGPLANARRLDAMEKFVADAEKQGATIRQGGRRPGRAGYFFEPTVLSNVPASARIWNEEPFGPIASVVPFARLDEAVTEANRLPYGLAAYAFTTSSRSSYILGQSVQAGMLAINSITLGLPEMPFGGVRESGYGSEGGSEAITAYTVTKLITHAMA